MSEQQDAFRGILDPADWIQWKPTAEAEQETKLADLERVERERDIYHDALTEIARYYGQVCRSYGVCRHTACYGSYGAWATAQRALRQVQLLRFSTGG